MKTLSFNAAQQEQTIVKKYFSQRDSAPSHYRNNHNNISRLSRFLNYCKSQQHNRFGWLAAVITIQGCVMAPLTLMFVVINGNLFSLWIPVILAFAAAETTNLAALPTKITIPVFFAGIIIDILVIAASFIF